MHDVHPSTAQRHLSICTIAALSFEGPRLDPTRRRLYGSAQKHDVGSDDRQLRERGLEQGIAPVRTADDLAATIRLFRAYASSLDVDLSYQNFEEEMAAMPGKYAPPGGELLLARDAASDAIGCVGLRPIEPDGCCEMKRLYVAPEDRGCGLGKALVDVLVEVAERIGYQEMRLDTLPSMAGAQALYRKLGFEVITPYYETPVAGTVFMRRVLRGPRA
jgi:GNAT superfamily N-acetyltransferase